MSRPRVFVDSSAWLALALTDDAHHTAAARTLRELLNAGTRLVTTNHVAGETYTFLARAKSPRIARAFIERLRAGLVLDRHHAGPDQEDRAYALLAKYADQRFSFVDAVSFIVMQDLGLQEAFAFDRHFETAGFARRPQP